MANYAAANWGHDSGICFYNGDTGTFHTIEVEKITGIKHYRGHRRLDETKDILQKCFRIAEKEFGIKPEFEMFVLGWSDNTNTTDYWELNQLAKPIVVNPEILSEVADIKDYCVYPYHHEIHAWAGISQSSFDRALVFTIDGVGNDGSCRLFGYKNKQLTPLVRPWGIRNATMGNLYYTAGCVALWDITTTTPIHLDVPGKVMGMAAYGRNDTEMYRIGRGIYRHRGPDIDYINPCYSSYIKRYPEMKHHWVNILSDTPEHYNPYEMMGHSWLDREQQQDIARGIQDEFESHLIEVFGRYKHLIDEYDRNVILSGGVAMNVVGNERLQRHFKINVEASPHVADCGLSHGALIGWMSNNDIPYPKHDITYSGPKVLDRDELPSYIEKYSGRRSSLKEVASFLRQDKIIGLVQGGLEVGPRALGNRSILCDPKGGNKKDKVNLVKRREPYRPFAPVCRREDAEKYFDAYNYDNLSYMNFAVKTRPEYIEELAAVTHVDGTARLQTVTAEQNPNLYELLNEFGGVLLNTSFNVGGKPILNTLKEAFYMLDETPLEMLVIIDDDNVVWVFE